MKANRWFYQIGMQYFSLPNILFKDSGQSAPIIDGESFILKSNPGTTNITLLDPNDDLYVDTDFDGVCDELELYGCTNPAATNYDFTDTDLALFSAGASVSKEFLYPGVGPYRVIEGMFNAHAI